MRRSPPPVTRTAPTRFAPVGQRSEALWPHSGAQPPALGAPCGKVER